jgi:hypothetical protein
VSGAASTIGDQVKELLDAQLANGADIVGQLGSSVQRAAEDLEQSTPQMAGLVRGIADRMETYAEDLRDQSVDDLLRTASNFDREAPGQTPIASLTAKSGGFGPATTNAYRVGSAFADAIIADWTAWSEGVPAD